MSKHSKLERALMRAWPSKCAAPHGYIARQDWAEAQTLHGLKQTQCKCGLWHFPQETCDTCMTVQRIQLRRTKGWRMPPNTVKVDRRTRWGNPCRVGMYAGYTQANAVRDFRLWVERDLTVRSFDNAFGAPPSIEEIVAHLHGKNLACWCKPGDPCHAEVLLEIANKTHL